MSDGERYGLYVIDNIKKLREENADLRRQNSEMQDSNKSLQRAFDDLSIVSTKAYDRYEEMLDNAQSRVAELTDKNFEQWKEICSIDSKLCAEVDRRISLEARVAELEEHNSHLAYNLGECLLKISEYEHQPLETVKAWSD